MGKEELGKIEGVFFGIEDHGILTFMMTFDFGGSGQGFGGYALDTYNKETKKREGIAAGTDLVLELLNLFGVSSLGEIRGRYAYAIRDGDHHNSQIIGVRIPKPEGGRCFMIGDWQKKHWPEEHEGFG
jgi:hypothetical protein